MAFLIQNRTTNGTGDWVSMSGPATLYVTGTFAGAVVQIEAASAAGDAVGVDVQQRIGWREIKEPVAMVIDPVGSYRLRAVVAGVSASTSISIEEVQG